MEYGYFDSEITGFDDATGLPIFDRAQGAEFIADMFASIWGSGVYPNPSNNLQVMERDDSQFGVKVMPGKTWIQGRFGKEIEITNFEFDAASATASRIDIIVAELNKPDREISLKYIKGLPADTPVPPDLVRTSDIYQICLAQCSVRRNAASINQSDILDTRSNTELCGYVSGVITQVDTQTLFNQYLAKMNELNALLEELEQNPPGGIMLQDIYDTDKNGTVDDAEKLGGQPPTYYKDATTLGGNAPGYYAAKEFVDNGYFEIVKPEGYALARSTGSVNQYYVYFYSAETVYNQSRGTITVNYSDAYGLHSLEAQVRGVYIVNFVYILQNALTADTTFSLMYGMSYESVVGSTVARAGTNVLQASGIVALGDGDGIRGIIAAPSIPSSLTVHAGRATMALINRY